MEYGKGSWNLLKYFYTIRLSKKRGGQRGYENITLRYNLYVVVKSKGSLISEVTFPTESQDI